MHKFIENIIGFSLKNHVFILFMTGVLFVAGIACYQNTPIEAYPDVTNTRAKIIAQWPGRSAEEVEKFVTLPIMQQLNTIPRKTDVRSTSLFGLAVVNVLFEDGVDDFYAQQYASNRIQELSLPDGVELSIEPPSGATGEIFRYILKSDLPIREVSAVNDWVVQRELLAVPGIATIATFGGEEKMYEIRVNPVELANYDISPLDVYEAVGRSNINVGGDVIQKGAQAYVVRGLGLLESVEDIENLLITTKGSSPIRVKEVATVSVSAKPRQGQVGLNYDDDVVQGIVIMLRGENPSEVIARLKDKITELNDRILPEDIKIVPFMDRTRLVDATVHTVIGNMLEGVLLVSFLDGTLQAVTDELYSWLSEGWTVEVGELGYFSVSLKCDRQVTDKKEIRSPSVHFQNVNLRLGSKFRNRFNTMELERKASPYVSRSLMGEEERKEKLLLHLDKYGCITRADYESITGLVKHRAVSDLNRYLAEGMIRKYGSGKTVVYLKP